MRSSPDLWAERGEQEEQFERIQLDAVCELRLPEGPQTQREALEAGGAAGGQLTRRAALTAQVTQTLGRLLDHCRTRSGGYQVKISVFFLIIAMLLTALKTNISPAGNVKSKPGFQPTGRLVT